MQELYPIDEKTFRVQRAQSYQSTYGITIDLPKLEKQIANLEETLNRLFILLVQSFNKFRQGIYLQLENIYEGMKVALANPTQKEIPLIHEQQKRFVYDIKFMLEGKYTLSTLSTKVIDVLRAQITHEQKIKLQQVQQLPNHQLRASLRRDQCSNSKQIQTPPSVQQRSTMTAMNQQFGNPSLTRLQNGITGTPSIRSSSRIHTSSSNTRANQPNSHLLNSRNN